LCTQHAPQANPLDATFTGQPLYTLSIAFDPVLVSTLVWFRNDLRVADHPALHDACTAEEGPVIGVYLVSVRQHEVHGEGERRLSFVRESLTHLRESLTALNIPLWVAAAPAFADAPEALMEIARRTGARSLYFNAEYPLNEVRRDRAVAEACAASGIDCQIRHGDVLMPPGSVLKDDGEPYSVYTPFRRRWQSQCSPQQREPLPEPARRSDPRIEVPAPDALSLLPDPVEDPDWPAGEAEANVRLDGFLESRIQRYSEDRDYPGRRATSRLSPYLSVGALSVRTAYHRAEAAGEAAESWLNELIWREFYRHVIYLNPHVSRGHSFRREYDALPWRHDPEALAAWQAGETGYPLVDAGMRQLKETGFMHNRLRMLTAMFLTKHLLIHWREGELHFSRHLRDADFASNNGGWQWSASTGTDAAPYFRIFNPESQAKKFDAKSEFIRRYVPELGTDAYPDPIVDHSQARERALHFFKAR
jgi:deoxyribodipyrimidine photo-lyase